MGPEKTFVACINLGSVMYGSVLWVVCSSAELYVGFGPNGSNRVEGRIVAHGRWALVYRFPMLWFITYGATEGKVMSPD